MFTPPFGGKAQISITAMRLIGRFFTGVFGRLPAIIFVLPENSPIGNEHQST
ncbi:hypothetical protein [Corynebacterium aquilae]|uniref:hypothetical protein n=1 Tax=Corynebacterium aquilae TaxID=203263 RepID=UPI0012EE6234|nr:hypothetical protein [Corynebacterium aquilae]